MFALITIGLVLFIQSPIGLIYVNRLSDKLGFWIMLIMVCLGIILNQIARNKYEYNINK